MDRSTNVLADFIFTSKVAAYPQGRKRVSIRFRSKPGNVSQPFDKSFSQKSGANITINPQLIIWNDDPSIPVEVSGAAHKAGQDLADVTPKTFTRLFRNGIPVRNDRGPQYSEPLPIRR